MCNCSRNKSSHRKVLSKNAHCTSNGEMFWREEATASNQKLDGGKAWEWEWTRCCSVYQTMYYLHYTASNPQWFDAKVHSKCSTTPICENTLNILSDNTCFPHARVPYKHNLKQIIVFCSHGLCVQLRSVQLSDCTCESWLTAEKGEENVTNEQKYILQCFKLGT